MAATVSKDLANPPESKDVANPLGETHAETLRACGVVLPLQIRAGHSRGRGLGQLCNQPTQEAEPQNILP